MKLKPRTLCKQLPNRKISLFYSPKSQLANYIESRTELTMALYLEFDNSVESFRTQPSHIEYLFEGRTRRYTPDFLVWMRDGRVVIIEVKCAEQIRKDSRLQAKLHYLYRYYEARGLEFRVITDEDLNVGHLAANLEFLYRYRSKAVDVNAVQLLLKQVNTSTTTKGDLCQRAHTLGLQSWLVDAAIAQGILYADLSHTYDQDLIVSIPDFLSMEEA